VDWPGLPSPAFSNADFREVFAGRESASFRPYTVAGPGQVYALFRRAAQSGGFKVEASNTAAG